MSSESQKKRDKPSLMKIIRNLFFSKITASLYFEKMGFNLLRNNFHKLMCYHNTVSNKVVAAFHFLRTDLQT